MGTKNVFKFQPLYSGSSGNSTLIQTNNTKILIDAGQTSKKIVEALDLVGVNPEELDGIVVTHEHTDHTKAIGLLSKKYGIPVYANKETWNGMDKEREKIANENINTFKMARFSIGDLDIEPFPIPHDAANPVGFNIYYMKKKISVVTDLGHVNDTVFGNIKESSFALLEANYSEEILKYSRYPYLLKQRIAGPNGHLDNNEAGDTIAKLRDYGLKQVILGHLSRENNFPELAERTILNRLKEQGIQDIDISVARRSDVSDEIEI